MHMPEVRNCYVHVGGEKLLCTCWEVRNCECACWRSETVDFFLEVVGSTARNRRFACEMLFQGGSGSSGVAQLLQRLLQAGEERHSLKRTLDAIEDTSARAFSLPAQAQYELMACKSRLDTILLQSVVN